jgi:hypothetical protein
VRPFCQIRFLYALYQILRSPILLSSLFRFNGTE